MSQPSSNTDPSTRAPGMVSCRLGIERFHARVLSDNPPARALGDKVNARWEQEEPGAVTTTAEIPALDDLPLDYDTGRQIQHVARRVIEAFD